MNHPKQILDDYGLRPKKSLGQNFIYDENILAKITSFASLTEKDLVLEIGPGVGGLTKHLARQAGRVIAVEMDERLIPILEKQTIEYDNISLIQGDILTFALAEHFTKDFKVVGNVPYYITGAILKHIFSGPYKPVLSVLTVQDEVAERLTSGPGDMSLLSVATQLYAKPKIVMTLKAGSFWPRPEVNSAVIVLQRWAKSKLPLSHEVDFFKLVSAGFSQKRKQIQKSLRTLGYSKKELKRALCEVKIKDTCRPQTLAVNEWIDLYWALEKAKKV